MNFLQQLKSQAQAVQTERGAQAQSAEAHTAAAEQACNLALNYLRDLVAQLNVIQPDGPALSLDGKTQWPPVKLSDFRFDSRKKQVRTKEVFQMVAMGWNMVPRTPTTDRGRVSVNFPPDLERVESRLLAGQIRHERVEQRHPDTRKLQAVVFDHDLAARGGVSLTPDHDQGVVHLRLSAVGGLDIRQQVLPAAQITTGLMDDIAKAIVGQPSRFG